MQRFRLGSVLFLETLMMGLLGAAVGIVGSIPLAFYFFRNPVPLTGDAAKTMIEMGIEPYMYFSLMPKLFISQVIVVFSMTAIVALYPLLTAVKLKVHLALRS